MLRRIKAWFGWRCLLDTGRKAYWENIVTGERKIVTYQGLTVNTCPTDREWLCEVPQRPAPRSAVGGTVTGRFYGRGHIETKSAGPMDDWLLQREARKLYTFPEALPMDMLRAWREGVGKSTHDTWNEAQHDYNGEGHA